VPASGARSKQEYQKGCGCFHVAKVLSLDGVNLFWLFCRKVNICCIFTESNKQTNKRTMNISRPIGQLKSKVTVYCTVCGCNHRRSLKTNVYANTAEKIEESRAELKAKAAKEYTCRICKSI